MRELSEEERDALKRLSRWLYTPPATLQSGALAGWLDVIAGPPGPNWESAARQLAPADAYFLRGLAKSGGVYAEDCRISAAIVMDILDIPDRLR